MTQESENSLREPDFGQTTSGATPDVVDGVAIAKLYGEPLFKVPDGLYIPPDALEVFLESFEGPLDLLLYLIRKQKFDVMNVPMALVTEQYMGYVELIRKSNLELAAEYLVMAACLMQIKSRLLLPVTRADDDEEVEDPQAGSARTGTTSRQSHDFPAGAFGARIHEQYFATPRPKSDCGISGTF